MTMALTLTQTSVEAKGPIEVSIVIATQRRPQSLRRAVASVLAQASVETATLELVVVDNDARPSALATLTPLASAARFPMRYVHEPDPGVANARNAAVEVAAGASIAFLDDDEEAPPTWLAALLEAQRRFGADVVFAPVRVRVPQDVTLHRAFFEHFFSRKGPAEARVIVDYYGCGDSLIRRAALPDPYRPFSARSNRTGGEDDMLFRTMQHAGARFAWAPEAWVWEDPPPERLNLAYCLRRAFAYGQGVTFYSAKGEPPDPVGAVGWMARGVAQVGLFVAAAAFKCLTRAPDRAFALDGLARGLGKVLWGGPFKIHFYGHAAEPESARSVPAGAVQIAGA